MSAVQEDKTQKLVTEKFEAYWIDEDTLCFRYFEDTVCEVEDIKANLKYQEEVGLGPNHKRLVHAEKYSTITKAAREYLQKHGPQLRAEAYVIPSLSQKILFNLFSKFSKNGHSMKGFDKLEDAIAWLKKQ